MPRKIETSPAQGPAPEGVEEAAAEKKREDSAHFLRHSRAEYKTFKKQLADRPQEAYDTEQQITPDLTEKGVELAKQEAEKFFDGLNPETDALFFVSSKESRALETADIYRQEAHKRGFEVIKPEHVRSKLAEKIGEGEIRAIDTLSLNLKNPLISSIFTPEDQLVEINWERVDDETEKRWREAHEMVTGEGKDKGSWGANYFCYSEKIKHEFPEFASEFKTAQELYEKQFKNILKLVRFGVKKAKESGIEKNVKIMGFGHEDYLAVALDKYFQDHAIGNCEVINFALENNKITAEFKGERREIGGEQ